MRLRLIHKLLIALFASTALVLLLVVLLTRVSFGRGFEDFLHKQELARLEPAVPQLQTWFATGAGWQGLASDPRQFFSLLREVMGDPMNGLRPEGSRVGLRRGRGTPGGAAERPESPPPGPGQRRGGPPEGEPPGGGLGLGQRVYLLDGDRQLVVGNLPPEGSNATMLSIEHAGAIVGWLGVAPPRGQFGPEEQAFVRQQRNTLLAALGGGLLAAALLAWLLARHLGRPVSAAARGIHELAAGQFEARVEVRGNDEIASLGRDLNRLADSLSEHERARQRWMSDIAHELRTPLAIIRGELEAIADGVRPMHPDSLDSVAEEVLRLKALIDDLHSLALSDSGTLSYKMATLDLAELVAAEVDTIRGLLPEADLRVGFEKPDTPVTVEGDDQRLRQLLRNLLENSARYTDMPGKIEVRLVQRGGEAVLAVSDSAPGVSPDECTRIFDRFHRLESSRNRNSGGSGLGLAICRNIVAAHGGTIEAHPGPLGGLAVTVTLPAST
jgi:two-component system sensor histidine kinase BaeS